MSGYGYIQDALAKKNTKESSSRMTIGRVVDTNDPQQMGRVRAFCPGFGDQEELLIEQIPWAIYISPLGGLVNMGERGAEQSPVEGPVAYGMWNIPKVGAYVLVGVVDGDPTLRFYAGCVHPQYMTHTMPHGRYTWNDQTNGTPDGPLDTFENKIQPLYDNLQSHFTKQGSKHAPGTPSDPRKNMEWRTRGVDNQTSAITNLAVEHEDDAPGSEVADHKWGDFSFTKVTEENGDEREIRGPGYGVNQQAPDDEYETTVYNYDSLIYSWTTPGFHSISMDDRHENSRIRIRTTSGHQIIMDDTNERIYISAAGGESWIEIDKVGNIDIFATKNISTHAGGDINFHSDKTIRMQANEGIHLFTDGDFRAHSRKDFNIRTEQNLRTHSKQLTKMEADTDIHVSCHGSTLNIQATAGTLHMKSQADMRIQTLANLDVLASSNITQVAGSVWHQQSGSTMELFGGGNINADAPQIHLNDGITPSNTGTAADNALQAKEYWAYWTSRVPEHEPWARVFMKKEGPEGADNNGPNNEEGALTDPNTHVTEFAYGDEEVGKGSIERNDEYERNPLWHR